MADIIITGLIIAALVAIGIYSVNCKKSGKSSCGCDCKNCPGSCHSSK